MIHPGSGSWIDAPSRTRDAAAKPVAVLAYRSRPLVPPSITELEQILVAAQRRNRFEGLTGILIYDQGHYFQWLEGPRRGLMRVWESIRADPRHNDFKILRRQTMPERLFDGWDMRLARRTRGEIDRVLAVMKAPDELLTRLRMHDLVIDLWRSHGPAVLLVTHDVDEAQLLADRVYVLAAGRIAADIPVALDRPRQPAHAHFAAVRRDILTLLGVTPADAAPADAYAHAPQPFTTGVSA